MRLRSIIATFLGSFLLFLLEPMVAKALLPRFGGSSLVWNGSLLFFQALLLGGYAYAHIGTRRLGLKAGARAHLLVLGGVVLLLPLFAGGWLWQAKAVSGFPIGDLLVTLFLTTAAPFFVLSAGTPLIQRWFGASGDKDSGDPYFLYAASNFGSLLGLISYPVLIEPNLGLQAQRIFFGVGLVCYAVFLLTCMKPALAAPAAEERAPDLKVPPRLALTWMGLAAAPSALLLAVSADLTKNIAPIPLLWVLPLALYLLTFIIVFSGKRMGWLGKVVFYAVPIALFPSVTLMEFGSSILIVGLVISLVAFFVMTLACHYELSRQRPDPEHLTAFYLWLSIGGAVGGLFVALIAPLIFTRLTELPLSFFACAILYGWSAKESGFQWKLADVLVPGILFLILMVYRLDYLAQWLHWGDKAQFVHRYDWIYAVLIFGAFSALKPVRFALAFGAVVLTNYLAERTGFVLEASRNYYGSHTVKLENNSVPWHTLVNGTTIHGAECYAPGYEEVPVSYYVKEGPVGEALLNIQAGAKNLSIGVVGLGSGTVASYGRPGDKIEFFELNPAIKRMAYDPKLFKFLTLSPASIHVTLGDARLSMESVPDGSYDVMMLDAFSSDSIPVHLLTKEAYELYDRKLRPGGVILVHTSNRFLRLSPVVVKTASAAGFVADSAYDYVDSSKVWVARHASTTWVALSKDRARLKTIEKSLWEPAEPRTDMPVWTDDYSNVFRTLRFK